jgi:type II secretory pathway component PulM
MAPFVSFLNGAVAMACIIAGIAFLAYWRDSRERLFVFFAVAFWVLAFNWVLIAAIDPASEHSHWFYLLRLVAFALIAVGIVEKNRSLGR